MKTLDNLKPACTMAGIHRERGITNALQKKKHMAYSTFDFNYHFLALGANMDVLYRD